MQLVQAWLPLKQLNVSFYSLAMSGWAVPEIWGVCRLVLMAIPQRVIRRRMALGDRFRRVAKGWQLRRDVAIAQIAVQT